MGGMQSINQSTPRRVALLDHASGSAMTAPIHSKPFAATISLPVPPADAPRIFTPVTVAAAKRRGSVRGKNSHEYARNSSNDAAAAVTVIPQVRKRKPTIALKATRNDT